MVKKSIIAILVILPCLFQSVVAQVRPAGIYTDNMVLQQKTDAPFWGTAEANSTVVVSPGWTKQKYNAKAGEDGTWKISIPTPEAGGPFEIAFSDGKKSRTVLQNVLVGEVWFCSGQSNMGMKLSGYQCQPVEGAMETIVSAKPSSPIRFCSIDRDMSLQPRTDCSTIWKENRVEEVGDCSAVAYFFAKALNSVLDVPVGLIVCAFGGSPAVSWLDEATVRRKFPEYEMPFFQTGVMPKVPSVEPVILFNSMVAPIIPFAIRGILWYQGEEDAIRRNEKYSEMMVEYAAMMRRYWNNPSMPFYMVEVAPFDYNTIGKKDADAVLIRAQQQKALERIPHARIAGTLDVGDENCIHPPKKESIGKRLAWIALEDCYSMKGFDAYSPVFKSVEYNNGRAYVSFKVGGNGICPRADNLSGFELAGEDGIFYPAVGHTAKRNTVEVRSPHVSKPCKVRYCWHNWCVGSVFNSYGIPALPFCAE